MSRTIVITGASAGVGRAVAQAYAARGDRLALIARGRAGLDGAERDCRERGAADVRTYQVDVADAAALRAAADDVAAAFDGIDVWVNDAFISVFSPAWDVTPDEYRRVMEVNYLGTVHGSLAALAHMRPAGRGSIVQVGSALAYRGIPLQAAYCASKHAIQGFNDSLRAELLHDCPGVTLSMVQLPAINTPQFSWVRNRLPRHPQPVPPIYQPEVAAKAVLWAADHGRRELNVASATLKTRLGDIVAPGLLDRYLSRKKKGYDAQQTGNVVHGWQDNIDKPLDESVDHGAHGVFDDTAKAYSVMLWARMHRPLLTAAGLAAAGAATAASLIGRRRGAPR
jgi:NAD(P)-dependent dehydrogenase (short-subunit alcohol dehydrogenase family)